MKLSHDLFSIANKATELSKSISDTVVSDRYTVQWQADLETAETYARYHYYMVEHGMR